MKVFITGGTGLIGSALINHLLPLNHHITVLTRSPEHQQQLSNVVFVSSLAQVHFADFDIIVNLAGEPIVGKRWSVSQKQKLCHSRWQLTKAISRKIDDECKDKKIRFISGSAVGFYGRQLDEPVLEEGSQPFPEFSHHLCHEWEQLALAAKQADTVLLRTGIVLSTQGGALTKMLLPFKLGLGGKVASGKQFMPWIHIDDMVAAIVFIMQHQTITGAVNMTAPVPQTNRVFSGVLAKVLNRPCWLPMPALMLKVIMGEMADLLVYGQKVIPYKLEQAGFEFRFPELEPALENLLLNKQPQSN